MGLSVYEIRFFESAFVLCFISLIYVTSCQLIIPSCLLFGACFISYRIIRNHGASKLPAEGKYVLITGCDTGFGNALARRLDRRGMKVLATCLSESSVGAKHLKEVGSSNLVVLPMNVASDDSVAACLKKVKAICQNEGLWSVVNNAGIDYKCYCEMQPLSSFKELAEVNLFGTVRVCKAFLPLVRKVKGRIVNVSSVLGLLALPTTSAYNITKFGVEGFSDVLRLEMKRFGVKVMLVEPGKYGTRTQIITAEKLQHHKESHQSDKDSPTEEIQAAYSAMKPPFRGFSKDQPSSDEDIQPVLDAFEDAILSTMPHTRYLVDGKESWIDDFCLLARLRNILPACILDTLVLWRTKSL